MTVIFLLIPLSVVIATGFLGAFIWAVRSGQYEDTCTPSMRLLHDPADEYAPMALKKHTAPTESRNGPANETVVHNHTPVQSHE
jgi:cbb3-type cytochrome oxidase maturation protein